MHVPFAICCYLSAKNTKEDFCVPSIGSPTSFSSLTGFLTFNSSPKTSDILMLLLNPSLWCSFNVEVLFIKLGNYSILLSSFNSNILESYPLWKATFGPFGGFFFSLSRCAFRLKRSLFSSSYTTLQISSKRCILYLLSLIASFSARHSALYTLV